MQIRDIVNRDIVNLTNCEHEPIHIPGSIQPHGFLIGVKQSDSTIDFCSANINTHTGITHEQALGKPLSALLDNSDALLDYFTLTATAPQSPISVTFNGHTFSCNAHLSGSTYIAEFEPAEDGITDLTTIYNQNLDAISSLQKAASLKELCQFIAEQVKKQTGYDRVMIYRFDESYNGEVYAESVEEMLEPFLGLHYPHTDIPVQARLLYMKNLLRIIVDVNYEPVPIYTVDDNNKDKNLDLGMASLRSVSPIHIQYLENMGVGATLTISLMHEGRLWGLIACHHYTPKYITAFTRLSAQLLGHLLASQIKVRAVAEEYTLSENVNDALERLMAESYDKGSFQKIVGRQELLDICNATGVAILFKGDVYTAGVAPDNEEVLTLAEHMAKVSKLDAFNTNKLSDYYTGPATASGTVAGLIYHLLHSTHPDCIMWFRKETLIEVNWAGDPQKAIEKNEKGLSPRKSFQLWRELIKGSSKPWANPEIMAAANFAHALEKHVHFLFLSEEETKYRELSRQLQEANAELENINWISTHDLREPLRKIQVFSSRILDGDDENMSEAAATYIKKMNESANRMQKLISDITSYSRLRHNEDALSTVSLQEITDNLLKDLQDEINDLNASVTVSGTLPSVNGIPLLLQQLFVNIIRNALKFRKQDTSPAINITYKPAQKIATEDNDATYHKISIKDNGIGFDNQYKENIFKIFSRLHTQAAYSGSGVGLALCKQIMDIHGGQIEAEGRPGDGAYFHLYFPEQ